MTHKNHASKKHHIIPKVYLREWSFNKTDSVYAYFKKNNYVSSEVRNINNILYKNNIYTLTLLDYYFLSEEGINKLFESLYDMTINDVKIENDPSLALKKLNLSPSEFIDKIKTLTIIDNNNNLLSNSEKNNLCHQLKTKKFTEIETELSKIDNDWPNILNQINEISLSREVIELANLKKMLVDYLVSQLFRNPNASRELAKLFEELLKLKPIEDIFKNIPNGQEKFKSFYQISKLMTFIEPQPNFKDLPFSTNIGYFELFNKLTFTLLIAPEDGFFVTSDSPLILLKSNNTSQGIYFPISPKILLYMVKVHENADYDFHKMDISLETLRYINDIILDNAKEMVISNLPTIEKLIDGFYIEEEWKEILKNTIKSEQDIIT